MHRASIRSISIGTISIGLTIIVLGCATSMDTDGGRDYDSDAGEAGQSGGGGSGGGSGGSGASAGSGGTGTVETGGSGGASSGGSGASAGTPSQGGVGGEAGAAGKAGASAEAGAGGDAGIGGSGGSHAAGSSSGGTGGQGGLDPALDVPTTGSECTVGTFCSGNVLWGCRIATPTTGQCETCYLGAWCGTQNSTCSKSDECGTLYQCYDGRCSSICKLGVGDSLCDAADCRDVGHATHGVCVKD